MKVHGITKDIAENIEQERGKINLDSIYQQEWGGLSKVPYSEKVAIMNYYILNAANSCLNFVEKEFKIKLTRKWGLFRKQALTPLGEEFLAECVILWHYLIDKYLFLHAGKEKRDNFMDELWRITIEDLPNGSKKHMVNYYERMVEYVKYQKDIVPSDELKESVLWHFGKKMSEKFGEFLVVHIYTYYLYSIVELNAKNFCEYL